jgi:LCP family protein required for cell wall assembly
MAKEKKISRRILKIRSGLLKLKRHFFRNVWIVRSLIFISVLIAIFGIVFIVTGALRKTKAYYYFDLFKTFVRSSTSDFRSDENRVNFLILGKGGAGHEAPDLTDTMIFASLSLDKNNPKISLVSLPRDIWIEPLRAKLNSVYYWGNQKEKGGGLVLSKAIVEEITGKPVHYAFVVDFSLFREVIDILGGVDVYVEESFIDNWYPIAGKENDSCGGDPLLKCRYETVKFEKGWQKMDGDLALKFVRSRKAEGDQGTDIARSRRQQLVIKAIFSSLQKKEFWSSYDKVRRLADVFLDNVETDIDLKASLSLLQRFYKPRNNIKNEVLPQDLLLVPPKSPKYDNLYVFIPKSGNWGEINNWFDDFLKQ